MKHSLDLRSLSNSFFSLKYSSIKNLPVEALPLFVGYCKKPIIITTDSFTLDYYSLVYRDLLGKSVAIIYDLKKNHSLSFPGLSYNINVLSLSFLQLNFKDCLLVFVEKGAIKNNILSNRKIKTKRVDASFDYNAVVALLELFGYVESLSTSPPLGTYVLRGGMIDVYVVNSFNIYRVSFLEDLINFFIVDHKTNIIVRRVKFFVLYESVDGGSESVEGLGLDIFSYLDQVLSSSRAVKSASYLLDISIYNYITFQKTKFSNSVLCVLPYVVERAFLIFGKIYFPAWFKAGKPLINKEIKALDYNSFVYGSVYIHEDFGPCYYLGLVLCGEKSEKLCLQFSDGKIFLNINFINKLSYFSEFLEKDALGSLNKTGRWKKKRNAAEKQANEYVGELVRSYLDRSSVCRAPYTIDNELVDSFVDSFNYTDTFDQKRAWLDIKKDLSQNKPMNRLVCGDVGFGKTEIAIRASFVVAYNSQLTLVLSPTTILAHQLYSSFKSRLAFFGINVGLVARTTKKNSLLFDDFLSGKVSILVGTHALLYNNAILKNTNLFIVDEEHRFGVKDKEKILRLNPGVDLLSLSATPIPRTLQLSLSEVKNISTIQTPPVERKPIYTNVSFYDQEVIVLYILKELSRKGQIYFVDNSVENLIKTRNWLSSRLPSVSIALLYGSLPNKQLLTVMDDFLSGKTSVLLTTTIVESGIDLSLVNTIIINNSHLFGLSQLYQLRGRVGRSDKQAYALLLIPKNVGISSVAQKRLDAILRFTSLGVGYRVALQDLEIRGSGSLFGYKQSGEFGVGFDYYTKLLSVAFKKLKDKDVYCSCSVILCGNIISKKFIVNDSLRATYYKKILFASSNKDLKTIKQTFFDTFGFCHPSANNLCLDKSLSFLGNKLFVDKIYISKGFVFVLFDIKGSLLFDDIIAHTCFYFKSLDLSFTFEKRFGSLAFKFISFPKDNYVIIYNYLKNYNLF